MAFNTENLYNENQHTITVSFRRKSRGLAGLATTCRCDTSDAVGL